MFLHGGVKEFIVFPTWSTYFIGGKIRFLKISNMLKIIKHRE